MWTIIFVYSIFVSILYWSDKTQRQKRAMERRAAYWMRVRFWGVINKQVESERERRNWGPVVGSRWTTWNRSGGREAQRSFLCAEPSRIWCEPEVSCGSCPNLIGAPMACVNQTSGPAALCPLLSGVYCSVGLKILMSSHWKYENTPILKNRYQCWQVDAHTHRQTHTHIKC